MNASTGLIVAAGLALAGAAAHADEAAAAKTANTAAAASTAPAAPAKPLDLKPPDITELYTSEQLEAMLDKMNAQHLEVHAGDLAGNRRAVLGIAASDAGLAHFRPDPARPGPRLQHEATHDRRLPGTRRRPTRGLRALTHPA
jgi:hypothetical protein